jgi:hypothetical protein
MLRWGLWGSLWLGGWEVEMLLVLFGRSRDEMIVEMSLSILHSQKKIVLLTAVLKLSHVLCIFILAPCI